MKGWGESLIIFDYFFWGGGKMKKTFFVIWLPVALLLGCILGLIYHSETKSERVLAETNESSHIKLQVKSIASDLDHVVSDLIFLSEQHEFHEMLESTEEYSPEDLAHDYLSLSLRKGTYDQIRFIDEGGMEIVRVNYNEGKPAIVPDEGLQSKSHRYYFKDILELGKGEVFVSPLDLNIEKGEIEEPFKPMIRFGTPVFDGQDRKRGIVVLNYLAGILIDNMKAVSTNAQGKVILLNSEGYWLLGTNPEDEWGFMFEERRGKIFKKVYDDEWQRISRTDSGQFYSADGLFTFATVHPLLEGQKSSTGSMEPYAASDARIGNGDYYWKVVSNVPSDILTQRSDELLIAFIKLYIVLLVLISIGTWFVARANVRHRKAEGKIRKLSLAVEQSPSTVVITDTEGRIEYVNPKFTQLTGYTFEEAMGQNPRILKSGRTDPGEYERLWDAITSGNEWRGEFCNRKKNGELYWEAASISPIKDLDNVTTHYLAVKEDITEHKKAEDALESYAGMLEESNRLKELFMDIMSHDLLNPAGVVRNSSEILLELEGDDKKRDILELIRNSSSDLIETIKNASVYSKLESMERIECMVKDLGDILKEVVLDFKYQLEDKGIEVDFIPEGKHPACVHPIIRSVFSNLISNAIKFSPHESRIEINIQGGDGESQVISVKDHGQGIPEEDKKHIFERFERLEREKAKGTGLGLAIVRRTVEMHGGKVWVEDNPGGGSIFLVNLPLDGN